MAKKLAYVAVVIIAIFLSYRLGIYVAVDRGSMLCEREKAESSFLHYQIYKHLKSDYHHGCHDALMSRFEQIIDEQKMIMSEYIRDYNDKSFYNYINIRDSGLSSELQNYEVDWNKEWIIQPCPNNDLKGK